MQETRNTAQTAQEMKQGDEQPDTRDLLDGAESSSRTRAERSFESFDPKDPRLVSQLEFSDPISFSETSVEERHYRTEYLAKDGTVKRSNEVSVASFEMQDTLDLLAFFQDDDGNYYIGVSHQFRPAQSVRGEENDSLKNPYRISPALYPNLPGGYLARGIEESVEAVLSEKLGVVRAGEIEHLGGAYFSSIGYQTEAVIPRAVEVHPPPDNLRVHYGENFQTTVGAQFLEINEALAACYDGKILDGRLLESILRFARLKGIELEIHPEITLYEQESQCSDVFLERLRSKKDIVEMLWSNDVQERLASRLVTTEIEEKDRRTPDFLETSYHQVQQSSTQGDQLAEVTAAVIGTEGMDCADIGAFVVHDGEIYFAVQRGPREALIAREESLHPIQMQQNTLHIDGVAGFLFTEEVDEPLIQERTESIVRQKLDGEISGAIHHLGVSHTSPGYLRERAHRLLVQVDSSTIGINSLKELYFVKGQDLLDLSDQGIIRDGRLTSLVQTMRLAHPEYFADQVNSNFSPELRSRFREMINSVSPVERWLGEMSPEMHRHLRGFPAYRRLLTYMINERGYEIERYEHPEEDIFFRANIPVFADFVTENLAKLPMNLIHDLFHDIHQDLIPFTLDENGKIPRDSEGKPTACTFEDYATPETIIECKAVWYSDVLIPRLFGIDKTEEITWRGRIARMTSRLGLDDEGARELIEKIELEGELPASLVTLCRQEPELVAAVEKLLEFHHLDHHQLKIFYQNWLRHPRVAETMYQFGQTFDDPKAWLEHSEHCVDLLLTYPEGVNMLKYQLRNTANVTLQKAALKLAYAHDVLNAKGVTEPLSQIDSLIADACDCAKELNSLAEEISNGEENDENLARFERLENLQAGTIEFIVRRTREILTDPELFEESEIKSHQQREFPAFDSQRLPPKLLAEIQGNIRSTLIRNGLKPSR